MIIWEYLAKETTFLVGLRECKTFRKRDFKNGIL
jgi:hypothetical protein